MWTKPVSGLDAWPTITKASFIWTIKSLWAVFMPPYLSDWSLGSLCLMTSHHGGGGFSDSSISPVWLITPRESYIFGFDIIHNSSINSTSHFLSVSCTFLTLPVYISSARTGSLFSPRTSATPPRLAQPPLTCLQLTFFFLNRPSFSGLGWFKESFSDRGRWRDDWMSFWL